MEMKRTGNCTASPKFVTVFVVLFWLSCGVCDVYNLYVVTLKCKYQESFSK